MARHGLSWMDDRVHPNTIRGLRDTWRKSGHPDWVGLDAEEVMDGDALQDRLSSLLDGVEGDDVAALTDRLAALSAEHPVNVDPLDIALARRTGTDMLAALCIGAELHRMVPRTAFLPVVRGPARRESLTVDTGGGQTRITVPLSSEASWCDGALTIARVLPNTFQIAVMGKPLAQLVSHPLLDPLGLTVDAIDIVDGRRTRLRTSHQREMVAATDIAHADLASDETALDTPPPSRRRVAAGDLKSPF